MASSVEALAEAFEGTLRELRRLRRHLKGASKPSSTDLQIQFLKLPQGTFLKGLSPTAWKAVSSAVEKVCEFTRPMIDAYGYYSIMGR